MFPIILAAARKAVELHLEAFRPIVVNAYQLSAVHIARKMSICAQLNATIAIMANPTD